MLAAVAMAVVLADNAGASNTEALTARYRSVRNASVGLTATLTAEDQVVQVCAETSPTKWHLAHTTWFFERFCLAEHVRGYEPLDARYHHLFNSYYYTVGEMHSRPDRGLLSRPTVAEIRAYRDHVDDAMEELLAQRPDDDDLTALVTLGLNHEQQHQELLLTDIKQVFFANPLGPAYRDDLPAAPQRQATPLAFVEQQGGVFEIGAPAGGRVAPAIKKGNAGETPTSFTFDNETPRHRVLLNGHALADRLVTNGEFREFVRDGAYGKPEPWLADGWSKIRDAGWNRPLCWSEDLEREFTLGGWRAVDEHAPVSHVSFYEADAFARWAGARLPSEAEWEIAAAQTSVEGNLLDAGDLQPIAEHTPAASTPNAPAHAQAHAPAPATPRQLFGDVWEWCASSYSPYPGFKPLAGSLGEYNGKFMCNQMVVRGGSCATWRDHIRPTYRSFFYPHDRWQFLGFRLARDT
jgi:ergothioneine biosynthesis protein EgtB